MTLLIRRVQEYLENKYGDSEPELLCRIYMRRIDHLYYKVGVGEWVGRIDHLYYKVGVGEWVGWIDHLYYKVGGGGVGG